VNNGRWIKLYEKIWENPHICKDADHIAIWIYLLTKATHQDYNSIFASEEITLKSGQLITGRKIIAKTLKINESKVQRVLSYFQKNKIIEQQTTHTNRLISIVKWSLYQQSEQQVNNKRTTGEHIQEHKNNRNNNIKEKIYKKEKYFDNEELNNLFIEYLDLRKSMKMINTDRAIKILINKLTPHNIETQSLMLEKAIEKSWKSLYEVTPVKPKQEKRYL